MTTIPFGLTILPEVSSLSPSDRRASFVVRIDPPPAPVTRPPLGLVLALDVSGSMAGDKLTSALASAEAVVRALSANDTFACVAFHSKVTDLVPPTPMTSLGKATALEHLKRARAMGNTNLADAVLRSLDLAAMVPGGGRVLLLTDGCPTEGVTDAAQILRLTNGSRRSATLSTFGFGRDVNAVLLRTLSEAGRGSYSFIEQGEPPLAAIAAELGGLISTVAAGVSLDLRPATGTALERVHRIGGLSFAKDTGACHLDLPPLLGDEPVYVAFRMTFDEGALARPLALAVLRARRTDDGSEVVVERPIVTRVTAERGAFVSEAAKEVLLARAAVVLHNVSAAAHNGALDLAVELARYHGELSGEARASGVIDDPHVAAALSMIEEARRELGRGARAQDLHHDLVAAEASVKSKRSARLTAMIHGSFVSKSQRAGWDLVARAQPETPAPVAIKPR